MFPTRGLPLLCVCKVRLPLRVTCGPVEFPHRGKFSFRAGVCAKKFLPLSSDNVIWEVCMRKILFCVLVALTTALLACETESSTQGGVPRYPNPTEETKYRSLVECTFVDYYKLEGQTSVHTAECSCCTREVAMINVLFSNSEWESTNSRYGYFWVENIVGEMVAHPILTGDNDQWVVDADGRPGAFVMPEKSGGFNMLVNLSGVPDSGERRVFKIRFYDRTSGLYYESSECCLENIEGEVFVSRNE